MTSESFVDELQEKRIELLARINLAEADIASQKAANNQASTERAETELKALQEELEKTETLLAGAKETIEKDKEEADKEKKQAAYVAGGGALGAIGRGFKVANKKVIGAQQKVKRGYDSANSTFIGAQKAVVQATSGIWTWLFAFATIGIHLFDVINGFSRGGTHATLMFTLYVLLTIWAVFGYYRTNFTQQSMRYIGVSLFAFALPYILQIPFIRNNAYVIVALSVLPVWFLFFAMQEDNSALRFVAKLLVIGFAILLIIIAVSWVTIPDIGGAHGVSLGGPFRTFWTGVTDAWNVIKQRIAGSSLFNIKAWKTKINATFNPYAEYYAGQVEDNKEQPNGVYITGLKSLYPQTPVGTPPVILARLEAKTFLDGGVNITPSCRLERAGKQGYAGVPDPKGPIEVNYKLLRDVTCTFPFDNLTAGTYYGVMGTSFGFETWSYITDTFVSRSLIEQYYRQGRDINRDLEIDQTAEAIYTNGPVELGVSADEQPIDIDLDPSDGKYIHQRFGFTLANRWSQGELASVDHVDVLVPHPFELDACIPALSDKVDEGEFTRYTFDKSKVQMDAVLDYRTVTCQLVLPSRAAAQEVLDFGEKTPVTFVVLARYTYNIEERVPVRILER